MQALTITRHGAPEVLQVLERPDPEPGPGEIHIAVEVAGINFADLKARMGLYPEAPDPPCVVGYEVAGRVASLGPETNGFSVGEPVVAATRFGGYASQVCVPAWQVRRRPESMNAEEGAALLVNYLTAYHLIHGTGVVHPGSRVLVHMAAGGVGLAAIQFLRQIEGVTIFGTASASKHEILREAGVDHPIDYRTQDYVAEVRRLTRNRGVDLVLDALGGKDFARGYDLLAPAGRLAMFGAANLMAGEKRSFLRALRVFWGMPRFKAIPLLMQNRTVTGVNMLRLWSEEDLFGREIDALIALYEEGILQPRIDRVFPLADGPAAHRYIHERKNIGKVLLGI